MNADQLTKHHQEIKLSPEASLEVMTAHAKKLEAALAEIRPHLLGSRLLHVRHIIDRALGSVPNVKIREPRS